MKTDLKMEIALLEMRREEIKLKLIELTTLRLRNKERFIVYSEQTPIGERISLDSEISHLETDRQSTKVNLMRIKMHARDNKRASLVAILCEALEKNGLGHMVKEALETVEDQINEAIPN